MVTVACDFKEPEAGFVDVKASDPAIRYVGRIDDTNPDAQHMAFPAITIETQFSGTALDIRLEVAEGGVDPNVPYYEVSIDAEPAFKLMICPKQTVYPLARHLAEGLHQVRIAKRTESQVGKVSMLGFRVEEGATLSAKAAPNRLIEFVGDSITCGYGNEISTTLPDNYKFTSVNENALQAYGSITARALQADYVAVAASGRGMVRNYGGFEGTTAPKYYELTAPDEPAARWDHSRYSPDVIVINLGTNDFSEGLDAEELLAMRADYRSAYQQFLLRLRELHPKATLIAALGPMISDSYPSEYKALTSIRADIKEVIAGRTTEGDKNVFFFEFAAQSSPYGEDWHPTIATHEKMAKKLAPFIAEKKGW